MLPTRAFSDGGDGPRWVPPPSPPVTERVVPVPLEYKDMGDAEVDTVEINAEQLVELGIDMDSLDDDVTLTDEQLEALGIDLSEYVVTDSSIPDDDDFEELFRNAVDLGTEEIGNVDDRVDDTTASWAIPGGAGGISAASRNWSSTTVPPPPPDDEQLAAEYIAQYVSEHLALQNVVTVAVPKSKSSGVLSHFVIGSIPVAASNLPASGRRVRDVAQEFVRDLCWSRHNATLSQQNGKRCYGQYYIEGGVDNNYEADEYGADFRVVEEDEDGGEVFDENLDNLDDGWAIVDCGDVVVHFFEDEKGTRPKANLEQRWSMEGHKDDHDNFKIERNKYGKVE